MRTPILMLLVALCTACATSSASTEPATTPADVQARGFGPWTASVAAEHPLVGTAWSVADGRALSREELEQRVAQARFVLLGETHDHPDHHRLQGELLASAIAKTPGPAVAYEMLDPAAQAQIDAFVAAGSGNVDGFAELVAWADSGWPAWSLYRPAFAPVIEARLPILAAQFPRAQSRRFMSEGLAMLPAELVSRYGLDRPLPAELQEPLLDEMFASHCEQVPREHLAPMIEIQRIRDAVMADALLRGAEQQGRAVLVAGTGHTRASAVPRLLQLVGQPREAILAIGFVAVDPARLDPVEYGDEHDVIVLTPDIEREDPCKAMAAGG
ncbi:MAG TPA: ChaN family lipoprotein [Enhygromyxa sp.]|nr:ChaN family lipoprotein [Enhygromyxa sp.]